MLNKLEPYRKVAENPQTVILLDLGHKKGQSNTYSRFKLANKNKHFINVTKATIRMKRKDRGKDRKFGAEKNVIREFVQTRWNSSNPATRNEAYC